MNRERAEAHLRLLAEEELRRATMLVPDATAGSPPEQAMRRASVTGTLAGSAACPMRSWHQAGRGAPVARAPDFTRCTTERWCAWLHSWCGTPGPPSRWCRTRVRRAAPRRASAGGHPRGTGLSAAGCGEPVTSGPASPVSSGPPAAPGGRVARVLAAVGALDDEVADQILEDFELALGRPAGCCSRPGRPGIVDAVTPARPRPARPGARSGRVARLGQVIPVRGADVAGEVYLLSYARTASCPQVSLLARTSRAPGPAPAQRWPEIPLLEQFTATDDRAPTHRMRVRDLGGGADGWTLMLDPDPPHEPRWLDLTTIPGEPAVRIDLTRPPDAAPVTVRTGHGQPRRAPAARRRGAAAPAGAGLPGRDRLQPGRAAARSRSPAAADGLGDVIAALQAAGALSRAQPGPRPARRAVRAAECPRPRHHRAARPRSARTVAEHAHAPRTPRRATWTGSRWRSSACTTARAGPSCTCMPAVRCAS